MRIGKSFLGGLAVGILLTIISIVDLEKKFLRCMVRERQKEENISSLYQTMNLWCMSTQKGKHIKEYFEKHGYYDIAIYGMSHMGERLYDELLHTGIRVRYVIDKNAEHILTTPRICRLDQKFEKVDAVIVTAVYYFDAIEEELKSKIDCPIISLRDVIREVL